MSHEIVLSGSLQNMRRQASVLAVLCLVSETCFFSSERGRHGQCRAEALHLLGLDDAADDATLEQAILASLTFAWQFHCQGAASLCASCGSLIEPGYPACLECGVILEQPVGVLARPEWENRLTTRALEIAIATRTVADDLLMYTIFRSVRLLVLRNLANQSSLENWELRAHELREMILDAWPEGCKPGKDTWEYRFIRACAVFWLVAWPMLKERFTLDEIDSWNTKLVRATAVSSQRWADAGAEPESYAEAVEAIVESTGIDRERAIAALAPSDLRPESDTGARRVVIHPPDLVYERSTRARSRLGDTWLLIALEPDEDEVLAGKGVRLEDASEVARRFSI